MFDGFEPQTAAAGEAKIRARRGGSGPPLHLLHGHPQTNGMWHRVAPPLAAAGGLERCAVAGHDRGGRIA